MNHYLLISSVFTEGKDDSPGSEIIRTIEQKLDKVKICGIDEPGHAESITRRLLKDGAESILMVGDDLRLNEVVNGFFEDGEPISEDARIGIIPGGAMGANFQRSIGLPQKVSEAIDRIAENNPTKIDLGKITTADEKIRFFANAATTGVSASISQSNKSYRSSKWLKEIDGKWVFNWAIVRNSLQHTRFPLTISIPGGPQDMSWNANCVAICNGSTLGGGIKLAPDASVEDGLLDVVIVHDFSKVGFLLGVNKIRGDHTVEFDSISSIRSSAVEISCPEQGRPVPIDADGDFVGELPATFSIEPAAIQLY